MDAKVFRGDRLLALRQQRGFTQAALALRLQVGRTTVTMLENDKTDPSLQTLVDIARVFGTTTDYLLGYSNDAEIKAVVYGEAFEPLPFYETAGTP